MIIASYILHYGAEWLRWSVRSVIDYVDKVEMFYTPKPSHGHGTSMVCPESRGDLLASLMPLYSDYRTKLSWHDCLDFEHEGKHRTHAVETCFSYGADVVLVVDFDEIWPPSMIQGLLEEVSDNPSGKPRTYRVPMRHFWRSLKWVCDDPAFPTRVITRVGIPVQEGYIGHYGKVLHMGYIQTPALIRYKQEIHGHRADWREGWFENIFLSWKPGDVDVHPTNFHYWDPKPYEDESGVCLESLVGDHLYWGKDVVT